MKVAAFIAVVAALAVAGTAAASSGCCSPVSIPKAQFGYSTVQYGLPSRDWPNANIMQSVDYSQQIAVQSINNFTYAVEIYTMGATARTMVYIPEYNMCFNQTYNPKLLQYQQLCVGPGTEYNMQGGTTLIGQSLLSESWGNFGKDGAIEYLNVDMSNCIIVANTAVRPGYSQLGIFYNVTQDFDVSVFDIPSACDADLDTSGVHPRVLREVTTVVEAATRMAATARSPWN